MREAERQVEELRRNPLPPPRPSPFTDHEDYELESWPGETLRDGMLSPGTYRPRDRPVSDRDKHKQPNRKARPMVDINTVFSGDTLKASDLGGKDHVVTIESVEVKEFDDGPKLVVRFQNRQKVLIANKTNAKRIALITGSTDTETWPGTSITLRSEIVDFKGEPTPAIRVQAAQRPAAAPQRRPQQQPADPRPEPTLSDDLNDAIGF